MIRNILFGRTVDGLSIFVGAVIVINGMAITIGSFPSVDVQIQKLFMWIDFGCAWIFVTEALVKIRYFGWSNYVTKNWNRFDLTLVFLSSPVLLMPILDMQVFGVWLTLRLARLIRMFKILAFIPNREHLLAGIRRALKASIGVFLAIAFLLLFAALSGTSLFGQVAPELFGDPLTSAYSMFQIFTIEGWFEVPARLTTANNSIWWSIFVKAYFILFVVAGGMIGLSMLNAVFVDALVEDNNQGIEERLDRIESILNHMSRKGSNDTYDNIDSRLNLKNDESG